jgi:large subunit ribosomal protein L19
MLYFTIGPLPCGLYFCMFLQKLKEAEDRLMSDLLIKAMEAPENENIPELHVGDDVTVHLRIVEGNRERIQLVRGTVIRLPGGGNDASITVRRIAANGIGVERTFLLRSPLIEKIEVHRNAHVRRAKLYYLRDRTGKSARLREKRLN